MPAAVESKSIPDHVFMNGDTVQVRHLPETSPNMVVCGKVIADDNGKKKLDRVLCFWFDLNHVLQREGFDHLDLVIIKRAQAK